MSFFGGNNKKIEERAVPPPSRDDIHLDPPTEVRPTYGIKNAILLMRTVPMDQNVELVVAVIKTTLESLKVKVTDIIEDATREQQQIENRIADLRQQIQEYEREIMTRKDEIGRKEAEYAETTMVKERLEMAERAPRGMPSPVPRQMQSRERLPEPEHDPDADMDIEIEID